MVTIPDGPVSAADWQTVDFRVLHLLKEATKERGRDKQLVDDDIINADGTVRYRIWKVTARRSYALQNGLPEWTALNERRFGEALRKSAVINLNDTIPAGTTNRNKSDSFLVLEQGRHRWSDRVRRLSDLRPSIVVCGGTFDLVRQLLEETHSPCQLDANGCLIWMDSIPFVRAFHPSFRGRKHADEYEEFCRRCQPILQMLSDRSVKTTPRPRS